jgi:nucleoside-triphosphatase THEP1
MATLPNSTPKVVSLFAAQLQLGKIVRRAHTKSTRFVVDEGGEPQAVIMGFRDFLKTVAPEKKVLAAIRAQARKNGTSKLTLRDINREIRAYRQERDRAL